MKVQRTFTFIVARNFGPPLTWDVKVWNVYLGLALGIAGLLAMVMMSALFLSSYSRLDYLEREGESLREERDALREQLRRTSDAALQAKVKSWIAAHTDSSDTARQRHGQEGETQQMFVQPVRLDTFQAIRHSRSLETRFRIVRQGNPEGHRGGFIFVIFEDQTKTPPRFRSSPHIEVNEVGFPQNYREGLQFSRIRTAQTYRRSIRLRPEQSQFTHVTIYLFSLRGGLMAKERYSLDPALFTASL